MQEWAPLGEGADEIYANDLCRLSLVELGSDGAFAATFGASKAPSDWPCAGLSAIRLSGTPVLLVNVGMDETAGGGPAAKQLECCMGADAGDDALTHVVSLPSLLPAAPPDDSAAAAAGVAGQDRCLFFDYGVGALRLRHKDPPAAGDTLQLGVLELRATQS